MTTDIGMVRQDLTLSQVSKAFTDSGYFQDAKGQAQAIVKILAGQELGIGPVASMKGIHIIKGQVSLAANTLAAMIKRSGKYNYNVIQEEDDICEIQFMENGKPAGPTVKFTAAQARAAGTQNMGKWPAAMLFARCISKGFRSRCPDLTLGPVYVPEELGGQVNEDGALLESPAAAPAASEGLQAPEPQSAAVVPPDDATAAPEVEEAEIVQPQARKPTPAEAKYLQFMQEAKARLQLALGEVAGLETYQAVCRDNTGADKSNAVLTQPHYLKLPVADRLQMLMEIMNDMAGTIKTAIAAQKEAQAAEPKPDPATDAVNEAEAAQAAEGEPQTVGAIMGENGMTPESAELFGP